jgi:uncharacterized protein (TIGR00297 family)
MNGLSSIVWPSGRAVLIAAILTVAFALLAWLVRGATRSGAITGAIICFILLIGAGPGAFAGLVAVFLLAWISTRIGYRRKSRLGTAESKKGRKASQVLANLSVAAACALLHLANPRFTQHGQEIFALAMVAAFAEAAADTVSSELGQMQDQALMITTWKRVPAGTDGGITLLGTFSGIFAAILVAGTCFSFRLISPKSMAVVVAAAALGMLADSFLGALLERRGILNNDAVNFLGTLIAAALAILFVSF